MNTQITAIPKLYIGMDIHKKSWSLHFRTDLFDHSGFSMPPEPGVLYKFKKRRIGLFRLSGKPRCLEDFEAFQFKSRVKQVF